ncbi:DUF547 domain-containing protein [Flavobacterium sp. SM2513]|uniref:DUF547 domain-containing protein n=1 Tax=Flavobacterium sp. SM2513 TaxID=3424766 RepID=UPI003D7F4208
MKKYILSLFLLPLLSCGNNTKSAEIPVEAYAVQADVATAPMQHDKWNTLLQKHVSCSGAVNYIGFQKDSKQLQVYLDELAANVPTTSWSKNEVLAYWINAYNAYTVRLILNHYPTKSIKDIKDPWGKKFFTLGTKKYSLEEIEHEILRKMNEPRIHFAINCASFSCPNLLNEAYTGAKLEKQLDAAAKSFINDATKNTISSSKVEISKIFDWFGGDFKEKGSIIDYLNKYSTVKISPKAKVSYKDYNWSLND